MCGIVGCINRFSPVDHELIEMMCSVIRHRGPDDNGIFCRQSVGIGMQRLSILDIKGGHQPIFNEDNSLAIVYNGEVYNYKELYQDLLRKGHQFRSRCDTEVVIHQFEEQGIHSPQSLNGMFAYAIWDDNSGKLFMARDRIGIKPLYYYFDGNRFFFASEIKSLLVKGGVEKSLNIKALWDYLTFRYVPEPDTIWEGIKKLPPAHWLELDTKTWSCTLKKYWDMPFASDKIIAEQKPESLYLEEFKNLFEDSVSRHLQADVPVGILLSGGLDSSAVMAAVNQIRPEKTYAFSIGFKDGGEYNELPFSREAAQHLNIDPFEITMDHKDFIDFLPEFVYLTDEPLADLASIPLYYVSKLAAGHVKVVLSGEGSDEVLCGYDFENLYKMMETKRHSKKLPYYLKKYILKPFMNIETSNGYYDFPSHSRISMTNFFSEEDKKSLFISSPDCSESLKLILEYYRRVPSLHPMNKILYMASQSWLVEDLLMKADKMTMANSLELRVPFLDHRIVEWAARLPVSMKIGYLQGQLVTKKILRMYAKDKIPQSIISRPKKGFPVPAYNWLSGELKPFVSDVLNGSSHCLSIFEKEELFALVKKGTSINAGITDRHKLWHLLILELWMQRWLSN